MGRPGQIGGSGQLAPKRQQATASAGRLGVLLVPCKAARMRKASPAAADCRGCAPAQRALEGVQAGDTTVPETLVFRG